MPKIIIDDREIEVAAGTKVIEAAEQLGIMIPRFCYHPALGSVGACRVCAVKFLQGPFKGVQMSCMVDAQDEMVVSTIDPEAVQFRKYVIEWLMLHHPHDCPVCDEGGHCLLQDMTVSGGHGMRRYVGKKRTYTDQYLGPLLQHEMNRCIHCYRCARFYQEFGGYRDLGAMQSANQIYFGRFKDGQLESPFSGNLSDICPTGVFTDKPSRFVGRRWDYERSPGLCINCSLGCHTITSCRYRQVVRQEARLSESVNGHFICDRGRYGFFYSSLAQRPRSALVDGKKTAANQALVVLKQRLKSLMDKNGAQTVACVGSSRNSLETLAMIKRVCQTNGWQPPAYFADAAIGHKVKSAISRLEPELTVSLRKVESADFIAVLGADPVNEAPMLALAMRQAQRKGAAVAVFDPRPIFLPFEFTHLPADLDRIHHEFSSLIHAAIDAAAVKNLEEAAHKFYEALAGVALPSATQRKRISTLAEKLRASQRPLIVCGTDTVRRQTPALAADGALLLQAAAKSAGLFYIMPGANGFAAGLLADEKASVEALVAAIEDGSVKGLVLAESDPLRQFPDRRRLERAIQQLELLVALDYLDSESAQKADIFLPTTTVYETGGVYVNQEGRAQAARPAYRGGIPIVQTGSRDHPPRLYGTGNPGGDLPAAWQVLAQLIDDGLQQPAQDLQRDLLKWLASSEPGFAELAAAAQIPAEGARIFQAPRICERFEIEPLKGGPDEDDRLELIAVERTFGTEELCAYSACLKELAGPAYIFMNSRDANKLNLADGDRVSVELNSGTIEAALKVLADMAAGTLVLPRNPDLDWQKLKIGPTRVPKDRIRKVS